MLNCCNSTVLLTPPPQKKKGIIKKSINSCFYFYFSLSDYWLKFLSRSATNPVSLPTNLVENISNLVDESKPRPNLFHEAEVRESMH